MWWSLLLVAGITIVVLLLAWRVRRYERDLADVVELEYRNPPIIHDRGAPH